MHLPARPAVQDVAAGDGTTSVTVICGALLRKCLELLERGVRPPLFVACFGNQRSQDLASAWSCCGECVPRFLQPI